MSLSLIYLETIKQSLIIRSDNQKYEYTLIFRSSKVSQKYLLTCDVIIFTQACYDQFKKNLCAKFEQPMKDCKVILK